MRRAVALVEDAIARYALPRFSVDKDFVADLRGMPPALSEVYVMTIFTAWERRAARMRMQVCGWAAQRGGARGEGGPTGTDRRWGIVAVRQGVDSERSSMSMGWLHGWK